jgi:hypothetical protein
MAFDLKQFLATLAVVAPALVLALPGGEKVAPYLPLITKGIADAQATPGATGATKRAFVLALVDDAVKVTALANPKLIDPALTVEAAGLTIDAIITTINAVQKAHDALPGVPAVISAAA